MRGLVRALVAGLPVVPLIAVITVTAAPAAHAENNGVGLTPAMGWSSWSFLRHGPTAANIEAEAAAMKSSGLASVGYGYVNLDDFWYQCPGSQGPAVDQYGHWVIDSAKFPADAATGRNGIQVVAGYVHSLGLKFGLYVTPGISAQAVDGSATGRQAMISVNGGTSQTVSFTPTGSFSAVGTMTVPLQLTAGSNTIEFSNPAAFAPDFDRIIVAAAPG